MLIQLGGLGFMTMASLIALVLSNRIGLRLTLAADTERRSLHLGDVRRVLVGVAIMTVVVELVAAVVLTVRFAVTYDEPLGPALWHGVFTSVSAFNNAGVSLYPQSVARFSGDAVVLLTLAAAIIIGGLGFPVLVDLFENRRRLRRLTVHSRLTLVVTGALFVIGIVALLGFEWRNPSSFGPLPLGHKLLDGTFAGITPRTAGFSTVDPRFFTDEGLLATIGLMFVGAGSAGTSGGIKVTTFAVLGLVILAEMRGHRDVNAFGRRISAGVQRQATTVALLGGRARRVRHARADDRHAVSHAVHVVRGGVGVRHGRAVHGHHGGSAGAVPAAPDRHHVHRTDRPRHARHGTRAALPVEPLPLSRGGTPHWLNPRPLP